MPARRKAGAQTLAKLRKEGYTVDVKHTRTDGPLGGETTAHIYSDKERKVLLAAGTATCRENENFDRKLGLTIAIGRANKALEETIPF